MLGLYFIEQHGHVRVPFLQWMAIGLPMVGLPLLTFAVDVPTAEAYKHARSVGLTLIAVPHRWRSRVSFLLQSTLLVVAIAPGAAEAAE